MRDVAAPFLLGKKPATSCEGNQATLTRWDELETNALDQRAGRFTKMLLGFGVELRFLMKTSILNVQANGCLHLVFLPNSLYLKPKLDRVLPTRHFCCNFKLNGTPLACRNFESPPSTLSRAK